MLFASVPFLFQFLPAVLLAVGVASMGGYGAYLVTLIASSLIFYSLHVPIYVAILLVSAAGNYVLAGLISASRRRWLLGAAVAANLAALAWFKYADFFIANLNAVVGAGIHPLNIVLPLALSFITFEQIAFLSDVHHSRIDRGTILEYVAFITLFPKLIAGPIIRYGEIVPQFRSRQAWTAESVFTGLCIFCFGLFKKTVIADTLSPFVGRVYEAAATSLVAPSDAVGATLAYATQIYFDFSAYSDMAIGLAWMLGLHLPINFLSPYQTVSIIEFWRHWHITLSRFLRDYLYIPLGGSRLGTPRTHLNIMIVMLLGGLWHGAAWTFVAWGTIHGVALVVNRWWRSIAPRAGRLGRCLSWTPVAWIITITVVLGAWVFFRAPDFAVAGRIFRSLAPNVAPLRLGPNAWAVIAASWAVALLMPNVAELFRYARLGENARWGAWPAIPLPDFPITIVSGLALAISMAFLLSGKVNAFIYFQF